MIRETVLDRLIRELEDVLYQFDDEPGVWDAAGRIFRKLLQTTDAKFWIEIDRSGMFALDYIGELVSSKPA